MAEHIMHKKESKKTPQKTLKEKREEIRCFLSDK